MIFTQWFGKEFINRLISESIVTNVPIHGLRPGEYEESPRTEKRWDERNEWERDTTKPKGCKVDCPTCFKCTNANGKCTYG